MVCVVSLISDQPLGRRDSLNQMLCDFYVSDIAWRQGEGDRSAAIIGQGMYFAGPAAARGPDSLRFLPLFPPLAERCAFT